MEDKFYGQIHGFVNWSKDIGQRRLAYKGEKAFLKKSIPRHADPKKGTHVQVLSNMKDIITKKQLPLYDSKVSNTFLFLKGFRHKTEVFQGAEFKERGSRLLDKFRQIHRLTKDTHDHIRKQHKMLRNLSENPEGVMDNFHYLMNLEEENDEKVSMLVNEFHTEATAFCYMIHDNYFQKCRDLAKDKKFLDTHKDIFEAAYMFALAGEYLANVHGLDCGKYINYWKGFYKEQIDL